MDLCLAKIDGLRRWGHEKSWWQIRLETGHKDMFANSNQGTISKTIPRNIKTCIYKGLNKHSIYNVPSKFSLHSCKMYKFGYFWTKEALQCWLTEAQIWMSGGSWSAGWCTKCAILSFFTGIHSDRFRRSNKPWKTNGAISLYRLENYK